ncbi:MAG: hypothetical protein ABI678_10405 [Kofleriaceae bacterium]
MKALVLVVALLACKQDAKPPPSATPPVAPVVVVIDAGVAKPTADAWVETEGAEPPSILETESFGALKVESEEAELVRTLGPPKKKSKPQEEGATGDFVSDWTWDGASVSMASETKKGPWKARLITLTKGSKLATSKGIHLGSTRAEVEKAYTRSEEDDGTKKDQYLVGSLYGGLLFGFDKANKVSEMSMGPFAF